MANGWAFYFKGTNKQLRFLGRLIAFPSKDSAAMYLDRKTWKANNVELRRVEIVEVAK